jgi:hydroxylamine reductase (hybrid-cluster protein)
MEQKATIDAVFALALAYRGLSRKLFNKTA